MCLFIIFFDIGLLVLIIGKIHRTRRVQFRILFSYKLSLEMIQRGKLCSFSVWSYLACRLSVSNIVALVNFFRQISPSTYTGLFEVLSQSASMFGTGPGALQGLVLQGCHVWALVVINT